MCIYEIIMLATDLHACVPVHMESAVNACLHMYLCMHAFVYVSLGPSRLKPRSVEVSTGKRFPALL